MIDRLARWLISASGAVIIGAVLGIGVFLLCEVMPLFMRVRVVPGAAQSVLQGGEQARLLLVDEYQDRVAILGEQPVVLVRTLPDGRLADTLPLAGLEGQRVSAAARTHEEPTVALGTDRGLVWIGRVDARAAFEGRIRSIRVVVEPQIVVEAVPGHRITALAYRSTDTGGVLACVADQRHLRITRLTVEQPLIGPARRRQESFSVPLEGLGQPTGLLLDEPAKQLVAGTTQGQLARWRLLPEGGAELLEVIQAVPDAPVSALAFVLGGRSLIVGGGDGSVATWSLISAEGHADGRRLSRIHAFSKHPGAVAALGSSPRDKGFATASADGMVRLHYMTSERTLATLRLHEAPVLAAFAPKADGLLVVDAAGGLRQWRVRNPHPEFSWRALFRPVWYEGYATPEYIWQSSGGTDDVEPKFSMVPLIVGTLKGTCYAMLFAVPLALFGALHCSQFLDRRLRAPVKSSIELMAALPSVVLGFVAGVVLAPLVHGRIVSVLITPLVVPLVALAGMAGGRRLRWPAVAAAVRRHEFWALVAWIGIGVAAAAWLGPWIERAAFRGGFEAWLLRAAGTRYDQRNSLVVGWAMGFAVIPIIFTICEDAFSAVPRHLVGASLACGASPWQTAWRVILPAAGSGVFSAIMVGFGRAVGETMIVLMATGNTPIMDWSLFNGFRALSANIAVEIPEAPHGGTLYRVLCVAALLLFCITSAVNTAAELVRLRLRRQLQGL